MSDKIKYFLLKASAIRLLSAPLMGGAGAGLLHSKIAYFWGMLNLVDYLSKVPDNRRGAGQRHNQVLVLLLVIMRTMSGY